MSYFAPWATIGSQSCIPVSLIRASVSAGLAVFPVPCAKPPAEEAVDPHSDQSVPIYKPRAECAGCADLLTCRERTGRNILPPAGEVFPISAYISKLHKGTYIRREFCSTLTTSTRPTTNQTCAVQRACSLPRRFCRWGFCVDVGLYGAS